LCECWKSKIVREKERKRKREEECKRVKSKGVRGQEGKVIRELEIRE
jgi:hypothetical protein